MSRTCMACWSRGKDGEKPVVKHWRLLAWCNLHGENCGAW